LLPGGVPDLIDLELGLIPMRQSAKRTRKWSERAFQLPAIYGSGLLNSVAWYWNGGIAASLRYPVAQAAIS
jgi:hypothetical protein